MDEEEFLRRTLNKIAKEFGYDVASTLELIFIKKEKQLDQYKKQLQNISSEFLKYDWENSTKEQIINQLKSLYNAIFKNGGDE